MAEVLIIGGGRIGSYLLALLRESDHDVRLIEVDGDCVQRLLRHHPKECIVHGSGTDPEVLEAAGARGADTVVAVTNRDETNLVVTSLVKFEFGVPRTIGRVNNPRNAWLYGNDMGVDVTLNQADVIAHLVAEEMSMGEMMTLLKLRRGRLALVEEKVHPASIAAGSTVAELDIHDQCLLVGILRGDDVIVPHGDTAILAGDELLAVVSPEAAEGLAALLGTPGVDTTAATSHD